MIIPWWQALRLRPEVSTNSGNIDDVQMSLFRAVYGNPPAPYGDPVYYGAITHPTTTLAGLMSRIAVRLGGGDRYTSVRALYHLDQGMGGGKSHGLIGLYHMAKSPHIFSETDLGQMVWAATRQRLGGSDPDLINTHVVVLSADHMTPFAPDPHHEVDGPASTLWERFLWRLVEHNYEIFRHYQSRWDQEGITQALASLNRPILILVDEIMDYVRQLDDTKYEGQRNTELAFLKALFDAVNDIPHVALVIVMISTEQDKAEYGRHAQGFREELLANIVRNGTSTAVTEASDFSQIIRRRLFETSVSHEVAMATATYFTDITSQWKTVLSRIPGFDSATFPAEVTRAYPFHPDLLRLVETEWGNLAGYQRVRSTVALFAQTVYIWMERAKRNEWVPLLIGLGDLPLDQSGVREALLSSGIIENETTAANYRQVIASDIVGEGGIGGIATKLDHEYEGTESWYTVNPQAAQRMATALLLYSLVPRSGGRLGATEAEIKAASFVSASVFAATDAETIFNALKDTEIGLGAIDIMSGLGGQPPRYQLTTRQTLQMLFRVQRGAVTDKERDSQIAIVAEKLIRSGAGFSKTRFIKDESDSQGRQRTNIDTFADLDERNATRLVVLDPSRWTLLNGRDDETRRAITMAFGVGPEPLPVTHAASLVIACVNTQRRGVARQRAAELLAWSRVANVQIVRDDAGWKAEAENQIAGARASLEKEVRRAFQHFAYLLRDAQNVLEVRFAKFDEDGKSSLSGANIWDQLVEAGRAVTPGALTVEGLLLAIKDELPRSLAEISALFWTNPRMPMLSSMDELRRALFNALNSGKLQLVTANGDVAPIPDRAGDLPISATTITVRMPVVEQESTAELDAQATSGESQEAGVSYTNMGSTGKSFVSESPIKANNAATPTKNSEMVSTARAQLWMKLQTDLSYQPNREKVFGMLLRLKNIIDDGDLESIVLTMDIVGSKERLTELIEIAKPLEGMQHRLENLPD
ncbi:MAG TPA: DUF499 domain-containing protein [Ktedonobacteraceae bacterium]